MLNVKNGEMKKPKNLLCRLFLLLVLMQFSLFVDAQGIVKGTVVDSSGEPIIGAAVQEKGLPSNGVATDFDGNFTLELKSSKIATISYIGMLPLEVQVSDAEQHIVMKERGILEKHMEKLGVAVKWYDINSGATQAQAMASGDLDATDEGVFSGKEELTTVTLGDQVKTLSDYMFTNSAFDSIDLNKVETIGKGVFMGSNLNVLTIPATLETIDVNAFVDCDNLEYLYIPDGTETLTVGIQDQDSADWGPFYDSPLKYAYLGREINYVDASGDKFTADEKSDGFFASEESIDDLEIILGDNVKTISDYMFAGLNIQEISIPASVDYIGWEAFLDCEDLSSVTFEDGPEPIKIHSQTFAMRSYGPFYESPLTEVYVGREIDYEIYGTNYDDTWWALFASKKSVDKLSVTLSNNVKTIVQNMFGGCPITEITIPASVTKIQNNAFEDCTKLSKVTFESSTTPLTIGYQVRLDNVGPFYHSPLSYIKLDRELVPSASYQKILDAWDMGVFANKHYSDGSLTTTVNLGSNVKTILPYMFSGVRLSALWIPTNVESIGDYAFYDCRKLGGVTLGHHNPPTLGEDVFDSCDVFWYISVPKGTANTYKAANNWKDWVKYNGKQIYHEYN